MVESRLTFVTYEKEMNFETQLGDHEIGSIYYIIFQRRLNIKKIELGLLLKLEKIFDYSNKEIFKITYFIRV